MEILVYLAHHQDNGTIKTILAPVQHLQLNGMELNVPAQSVDMGLAVLNAHLQGIGIQQQINASVIILSFGMEKIVCAHNLISFIKEDVENAQMDSNGNKIVAKNAIVHLKIYKFLSLKLENKVVNNRNDHLSFGFLYNFH